MLVFYFSLMKKIIKVIVSNDCINKDREKDKMSFKG
jgi:hypothetical protein